MIIKPSISFVSSDSDPLFITDVKTIITSLTGNPGYASPTPELTVVQAALDDFSTAFTNAADGGRTLTAIKDGCREALAALVRSLANYVEQACDGDLSVLLSSGFPIQKPQKFPIGPLSTPFNLRLKLGAVSGALSATVSPVYGVSTYNWRIYAASAPTVILQTAQTTGGNTGFTGLTPGVIYAVQANAVGTAGTTDWSNPVTLMVV
jgi:hypothetical protein